ncbi:unnamed protein product [Menidia menidia]|uniref:(Atlantic silverside) hypothetical protein n=1 Tax=Menidia menidia TaxID=238744 RepID=A0A8S4BWA5_9TELE|nr:unnamed protein product [Menidia menidia]CAG6016169.1 unnamed protein product [Menidia menidia]CAG6016171.1 unnamed protein product [Menidia menidia]CAG6016176.1 unnamed protein product [Menidia menidia]
MRLYLLFSILCWMVHSGYSQLIAAPGLKGEKGDKGDRGLPGFPGYQGERGHLDHLEQLDNVDDLDQLDLLDLPQSVDQQWHIVQVNNIFGSVSEDVETLRKTVAKLEKAINFNFARKVGQKYFVTNKERGSFWKAVEFCSQPGLELALPQSEEENSKLAQLWDEADEKAWINVNTKKAEGNFETNTNNQPLTFTKWGAAQPDETIQETGCSLLSGDGVWRVVQACSMDAYIICQL